MDSHFMPGHGAEACRQLLSRVWQEGLCSRSCSSCHILTHKNFVHEFSGRRDDRVVAYRYFVLLTTKSQATSSAMRLLLIFCSILIYTILLHPVNYGLGASIDLQHMLRTLGDPPDSALLPRHLK